jgi:carbon storage regulator
MDTSRTSAPLIRLTISSVSLGREARMFIITRRPRQQLKVGPDITIAVLEVNGAQCRIGIEALRSVEILRGELAKSTKPGLTLSGRPRIKCKAPKLGKGARGSNASMAILRRSVPRQQKKQAAVEENSPMVQPSSIHSRMEATMARVRFVSGASSRDQ